MKKVLLLSVTAGYGHHSAAQAITDALRERGAECETIDLMKIVGKLPYYVIDKGYGFTTHRIPHIYGAVFGRMNRRVATPEPSLSSRALRAMMVSPLMREIDRVQPDAMISTHVFGALAVDELVRHGHELPKHLGLVTDYDFHPFWEDVPYSGGIITGSDLMAARGERRGIDTERLLPLGIPVASRFERSVPKEEARRRVGVPSDAYAVLMASGSMGFADLTREAVKIAKSGAYTLIVCGRNAKMKAELETAKAREGIENMKIYGFVTDGELLMDAADCIVTKPGGLTTTEAMVKRLPMMLYGPIPGQEDRNAEFLSAVGAGIVCTRDLPPSEAVHYLRSHPAIADRLREACARVVTPGAAGRIAEALLSD